MVKVFSIKNQKEFCYELLTEHIYDLGLCIPDLLSYYIDDVISDCCYSGKINLSDMVYEVTICEADGAICFCVSLLEISDRAASILESCFARSYNEQLIEEYWSNCSDSAAIEGFRRHGD